MGHRRDHTCYETETSRVILQADPIENGGITEGSTVNAVAKRYGLIPSSVSDWRRMAQMGYSRAQVSAKSPTGLALKYIAKYWDGLNLFLTDGRIEIDNNRPIALARMLI